MATSSSTFLKLLLALLILGSLVLSSVAAQGCQGDVQSLIVNCARYVSRTGPMVDPPQSCCDVVRKVDVPCMCGRITKEIEKAVDMAKVVHMADFCGKPLAPGSKCGSYNVPRS